MSEEKKQSVFKKLKEFEEKGKKAAQDVISFIKDIKEITETKDDILDIIEKDIKERGKDSWIVNQIKELRSDREAKEKRVSWIQETYENFKNDLSISTVVRARARYETFEALLLSKPFSDIITEDLEDISSYLCHKSARYVTLRGKPLKDLLIHFYAPGKKATLTPDKEIIKDDVQDANCFKTSNAVQNNYVTREELDEKFNKLNEKVKFNLLQNGVIPRPKDMDQPIEGKLTTSVVKHYKEECEKLRCENTTLSSQVLELQKMFNTTKGVGISGIGGLLAQEGKAANFLKKENSHDCKTDPRCSTVDKPATEVSEPHRVIQVPLGVLAPYVHNIKGVGVILGRSGCLTYIPDVVFENGELISIPDQTANEQSGAEDAEIAAVRKKWGFNETQDPKQEGAVQTLEEGAIEFTEKAFAKGVMFEDTPFISKITGIVKKREQEFNEYFNSKFAGKSPLKEKMVSLDAVTNTESTNTGFRQSDVENL